MIDGLSIQFVQEIQQKKYNEHGGVFPHAINGYSYIKELGYDEEYAGICIKHSFLKIDLLLRHGVFLKTHYHIEETIKLKDYFDNLLGYNLYDLFPEIKDNL